MKALKVSYRVGAALSALTLAACASIAPQTARDAAPELPARFAQAAALPAEEAQSPAWWERLGDPTLARLIDEGLRANLDIAMALERVQQVRAFAEQQRLQRFPSGQLQLGATRQQASEAEAPCLDAAARRSTQVNVGLAASWEIDLFGRLGARAEATTERVKVSEAQAQAIRIAVAGEVGNAYFDLLGAREQLQLARAMAENQRQSLRIIAARAREGQAAPLDEARWRSELAAIESQVPTYEAATLAATHRIAVLLGQTPAKYEVEQSKPVDPTLVKVAVVEPTQLLTRRPDLLEAEAAVRAAGLDVQAVRAEFLPRLNVFGLLGFVAGSVSGIGAAGSASWLLSPTLSLPILDTARIQARLDGTRAQQREALLAYRQAVLRALEDVETSLARYRLGQARLDSLRERALHAASAERLARLRYEAGAADLLEWLDSQRTANLAQTELSIGLTTQRQQIVAVMKSMGVASARNV
jgi:NodT family efflux transporter outer membrane factor (OMF) lipoprotein